ncbi:MAG TPA: hypothetical protein VIF62_14180 [Labilithrix sp.]
MRLRLGVLLVGFAAAVACSDETFSVRYAPEWPRGPTRLSVLGVFKDGRLNGEEWDAIGPSLTSSFAGAPCEAAYGAKLVASAPALVSAVDDYTRANGVTDTLLDRLAPMAGGDAVLVITIAGQPPHASDAGLPSSGQGPSPSMGAGRRGRMPPSGGGYGGRAAPRSHDELEIAASLFSVRLHRSVALVAMTYTGKSTDEALAKFGEKLRSELGGSSCVPWRWDVRIDDAEIKNLPED